MADFKGTPGPWELEAYLDGVYHVHGKRETHDWLVTRLEAPKGDPVTRANARLIAAAPEMFASLRVLVGRYVSLVESGDCGFWDAEKEFEVQDARAAIAKALGEQS